jgi:hypothetical protein
MKNSPFKKTLEEYSSWFSIGKLGKVRNSVPAKQHPFGNDKHQYFLQFTPRENDFKYVGTFFSNMGYPTVPLGYRFTPKNSYPAQIEDVFTG